MIATLKNIPFERVLKCEFIVITHKLDGYLFSGNECYKPIGTRLKRLKMIRSGNSNGYKLNGKFRSLTWCNGRKSNHVDVFVEYEPTNLCPF